MQELLKKNFPNNKIYDTTDKTELEFERILDICKGIPEVIVYAKGNKMNQKILNTVTNNSQSGKLIKWMFLNRDNFLCFYENEDPVFKYENKMYNWLLKSVRKLINGSEEHECCICYKNIEFW